MLGLVKDANKRLTVIFIDIAKTATFRSSRFFNSARPIARGARRTGACFLREVFGSSKDIGQLLRGKLGGVLCVVTTVLTKSDLVKLEASGGYCLEVLRADLPFVLKLGVLPNVYCESAISPQSDCALDLMVIYMSDESLKANQMCVPMQLKVQ